jgi:ribosomal protein S18 acetylase RimI-like enzyme
MRCFRETFLTEGFNIPYPADDLALFEAESYGLEKVAAELADPTHATWLAEGPDGALMAYSHAGPTKLPHPEASATQGELYQIYILRAYQGARLGGRLMGTAFEWLAANYPGPVWLGVWSGNEKAQRFYAGLGFRKVGDYHFMVGDHADAEYIFRRD